MAVAIHQQLLYWQSALQGCELQPATKQVNIFSPGEPWNIRLWSSHHSHMGASQGQAELNASFCSQLPPLSATSGLRLFPGQHPGTSWFSRGVQPWLLCAEDAASASQVLLLAGCGPLDVVLLQPR